MSVKEKLEQEISKYPNAHDIFEMLDSYKEEIIISMKQEHETEVLKTLENVLSYQENRAAKEVLKKYHEWKYTINVSNMEVKDSNRTSIISAIKILSAAGVIKSVSLGRCGTLIEILEKDIVKKFLWRLNE